MFGRELRTPVDLVFGPPPESDLPREAGLNYYTQLREKLQVTHKLTRDVLAEAGARQKRAYDSRCAGMDFAPGALVWVFNPIRKKGVSPKLCSKWTGPCTVLQKLSDVVYRVQLLGRRKVVLHRDRLAPYQPRVEAVENQSEEESPSMSDVPPSGTPEPPRREQRLRRLPQHLRDYDVG